MTKTTDKKPRAKHSDLLVGLSEEAAAHDIYRGYGDDDGYSGSSTSGTSLTSIYRPGRRDYDWSSWHDPWPKELRAARSTLLWVRGYLGSLLYTLQPVPGYRMETLAVDQFGRLYYNDAIFKKWSSKELAGVLYHETQHRQKGHPERFMRLLSDRLAASKPPPDPMIWNLACDMEINQWIIKESEVLLPVDALLPSTYGFPEQEVAEEYYARLEQVLNTAGAPQPGGMIIALGGENDPNGESEKSDEPGDGTTPGSGTPNPNQPSMRPGCGSLSVVPEPTSPELEKLAADAGVSKRSYGELQHDLDSVVDGIEEKQRTIGMGTEEAHQGRWAQQRRESAYDWKRELRGELGDLKTNVAGQARANYRRPSRRQESVKNILLPGRVNPVPNVAAYGDTSGSMGSNELAEVARQLPAIVAACGGSVVYASIDNRIQAVQKVTRSTRLNLTGGGGTNMTLAIRAAQELRPRPQVVIILTDGMSTWKIAQPAGMRVIIGVIANSLQEIQQRQVQYEMPAWARVIPIPVHKIHEEED